MKSALRINRGRLHSGYQDAKQRLLDERSPAGHWVGELSTSPLAAAVAVVALTLVDRDQGRSEFAGLIHNGVRFLAASQNADGGWGDTLKSLSNISTTMLAHGAFHATGEVGTFSLVIERAGEFIERAGGVAGLRKRYGADQTFSVPILTCCALSGTASWRETPRLPFELACLPHRFYAAVGLPMVSYALPALIAIGQVRHHHEKPRNPLTRWLRDAARGRSLRLLETIQPPNGGFLEATPLTAFVVMSLAGMGLSSHPVARRGVDFLRKSVRADGSWPIDTNLATWVTTLSVNALGADLPAADRVGIREWLLAQQYTKVHPYTQAAPGGWAWTDLPGGVPDADDASGALLALLALETPPAEDFGAVKTAGTAGARWLLDLQNADGGWPTFCRGWGKLPFDRSSCDITAHALRALSAWRDRLRGDDQQRIDRAGALGTRFLLRAQRADGAWPALWFGNQHAPNEENLTYGSARVLASLAAWRGARKDELQRRASAGLAWIARNQNDDGGWGAGPETPSSVEETALAVEALLSGSAANPYDADKKSLAASARGLDWLLRRVEDRSFSEPSPIGFYFAKLWYFERLYPILLTVAALRSAVKQGLSLTTGRNGSTELESV